MSNRPRGLLLLVLAPLFLWGCTLDLGEAPFYCHSGEPKCPDGYECNPGNVCVKEGTCPPGILGCPKIRCGDEICSKGEDCKNCPDDCDPCEAECGDGKCDPEEDEKGCPADCKKGTGGGFGAVCDEARPCDSTLFCAYVTGNPPGFCTKHCPQRLKACSGAPAGATALCGLPDKEKLACGFMCDVSSSACPAGLACDVSMKLCLP